MRCHFQVAAGNPLRESTVDVSTQGIVLHWILFPIDYCLLAGAGLMLWRLILPLAGSRLSG